MKEFNQEHYVNLGFPPFFETRVFNMYNVHVIKIDKFINQASVETTLSRTNKFGDFKKHNCHHIMHHYNKIVKRFQKILDQNCTMFKNTYYKSHKSSFVPKKDFEVGENLRCYLRSIEKEILSKDNCTKRFIKSH